MSVLVGDAGLVLELFFGSLALSSCVFLYFGSYGKFWEVTEIMGLKSGTNPGGLGTSLRKKVPRHTHAHVVEVFRASQTHPCPYQGSVRGISSLKISGSQGPVKLMAGISFGGTVVGTGGLCYGFMSISLP